MNDFGTLINKQRKKTGLTQAKLADKLGVTNKTISKWETGHAFPETGLLVRLSDVLDIPVDDLLRGQVANENASQPMNLNKKTIVMTAVGLIVVVVGVIALIFMHENRFSYTAYLPVLMVCVAVGVFLISHAIMMQSFHTAGIKKWAYLFPLSLSVLIVTPLILIMGSAFNVPYTIYFPIFLIVLIPVALLFLISLGGWIHAQIRAKRSRKHRS